LSSGSPPKSIVARPAAVNARSPEEPAVVRLDDVFLQTVRSSPVQYVDGPVPVPSGRAVAYGLVSGAGCDFVTRRAAVFDGGFGLFLAGGRLEVVTGIVRGQLDAAAVLGSEADRGSFVRSNVVFVDNASNDVVVDSSLPAIAALPPPTPVCDTAACE
jgi:hypothetical protein